MTSSCRTANLVMQRYVGRSAISLEIADIAVQANTSTIVADNRDILADLFYTLKGKPYHIYARNSGGFPKSYYEQNFSLPPTVTGDVLFIDDEPFNCAAGRSELIKSWSPDFGNMKGRALYAYLSFSKLPGAKALAAVRSRAQADTPTKLGHCNEGDPTLFEGQAQLRLGRPVDVVMPALVVADRAPRYTSLFG